MILPEFSHRAPSSLQEASALLVRYGNEARVLAGGTDILVKMKHRRQVPRVLVNIKRIPGLDTIRNEPRGLRIGALVTIEALKASALLKKRYPMLHDAVSCLGTLEIRNCGTLAGNLCNASPAAETVPALMLLGAKVQVTDGVVRPAILLPDFILGPGRTALSPGELVTEVRIPAPQAGYGGAYDKFSLRRMDLAQVGVAAMVMLEGGACRDVRIMLSSVAPVAMRARRAEAALIGKAPSAEAIGRAAQEAAAEARPQADLFGTVEQKRNMVAVLVARVIRMALERAPARGAQ